MSEWASALISLERGTKVAMAAPWVRGEGRHLDSVQGRGVRRRRQIGPSTLSVALRGRRRMDRPRATFFGTWRGGNVTRWVADGTTSWMMAWFLDGDRKFRHSEGGFWIGNGGADEDWALQDCPTLFWYGGFGCVDVVAVSLVQEPTNQQCRAENGKRHPPEATTAVARRYSIKRPQE